jgi:hypothetical protein
MMGKIRLKTLMTGLAIFFLFVGITETSLTLNLKNTAIAHEMCKNATVITCPDQDSVDEKELTVFFYLRGDDNLGDQMAKVMVVLESFGSTDDINIVVQFNRRKSCSESKTDPKFVIDGGWEGNRRYLITKNEDPEYDEVTVERLLDLAAEHPGNPCFNIEIAQKYRLIGDEEKSREYMRKDEEGFSGLSKDEINKLNEEHSAAIEKEFGYYTNFSLHLFGFERLGITEIISEVIEELPNVQNNEYKADFQNFIEWGMKNFPAKNHVIVVSGHGGATQGPVDILPAEMREALTNGVKNANKKTGRNDSIDAIIFNSCLMGSLEAATEIKDNIRIMIGSESISTGVSGLHWNNVLSEVQKNIDKTGHFDLKQFAYDYVEYFKVDDKDILSNMYHKGYVTISAVDMSKLPEVLKSFNHFLESCEKEGVSDNQLFKAVANAQNFGVFGNDRLGQNTKHLKDFGSFLKKLKDSEEIPAVVKESAEDVLQKLEDTIVNHHHNKGIQIFHYPGVNDTSGLTIWAPDNTVFFDAYSDEYIKNVPGFIKISNWYERLKKAADNIPEALRNEAISKRKAADSAQKDENISKETAKEMMDEAKRLEEQTHFWNKENN